MTEYDLRRKIQHLELQLKQTCKDLELYGSKRFFYMGQIREAAYRLRLSGDISLEMHEELRSWVRAVAKGRTGRNG